MDLIIQTDGASRGNPGPAAYGYLIKKRAGEILHQEGEVIGVSTNNVAEYSAVLKALEYTNDRYCHKAPHRIEVVADSLLLVSQLSGRFKIKHPNLLPLFGRIKELEKKLGKVSYRHVPRAENFIADRLANIALDSSF